MKSNLLLSAAGVVFALGAPAFAQSATPAAPDSAGNTVGDIVVTAEHRSARLQDVPITITAATAEQLQQQGVTDAFDVGKITPSFNSNRTVGFGTPFMRGIGSTNVTIGDEPSVATYVDGFYQGTGITLQIPFNNIERIEVLKGPQGTLYGRNATGGAINLITRTPSDTFGADASVGYGNYGAFTANAYLTGPLANGIAADLAIAYRNQDEGYSTNLANGRDFGSNDYSAIRGKLLFDWGNDNSLLIGASYVDSKNNIANVNSPFPGSLPLTTGPGVVYGTRPGEFGSNIDPTFNVEQYEANATLRLNLGFANFVSLTQYRHIETFNRVEGDGTSNDGVLAGMQVGLPPGAPPGTPLSPQLVAPFTFTYASTQNLPYLYTQEFQLVSRDHGPFDWIVGAFYLSSKDGYFPLDLNFGTNPADLAASIRSNVTTEAAAIYAQGTYAFSNGVSVTGGIRYSTEEKHAYGATLVPGLGTFSGDQRRDFHATTYRLAVDYRMSPSLLLYATFNSGFKSGVFPANDPTLPAASPENLYAYEVGFKADPARFIRINGAVYYYDYQDLQTFLTIPSGLSLLQNAKGATLYGVELTGDFIPTDNLTLRFGLGYEHSEYEDFTNAQVYIPSPSGGSYSTTQDVSGNQLVRTPEWTANLGVSYRMDLGEIGTLTLNGSIAYTGQVFWDTANSLKEDGYALTDLSARLQTPNERYSLTVWGRNVTDEDYFIYVNPQQRYTAVAYGEPATYGVTLGMHF